MVLKWLHAMQVAFCTRHSLFRTNSHMAATQQPYKKSHEQRYRTHPSSHSSRHSYGNYTTAMQGTIQQLIAVILHPYGSRAAVTQIPSPHHER